MVVISQTAEYALRAVVCLASRAGKPMVTPRIAKVTHVPAGYLAKVLQMLARAGIVQSRRGLHGGFVLAGSPGELTVLDVVNAVDPLKRIETCPLEVEGHGERLCPLHRRLDEVVAQVERAFADYSIADLLSGRDDRSPLDLSCGCDGPVAERGEGELV
jgi:Rrf2 family nitric oxide-sensitive transcriptional repressor